MGCTGTPHFDAGYQKEAAMKITIETVPHGWKVTAEEDGRFLLNDGLGTDEAFWSVAQVMNEVKPRYLKSPMDNIREYLYFGRFRSNNRLAELFGGIR